MDPNKTVDENIFEQENPNHVKEVVDVKDSFSRGEFFSKFWQFIKTPPGTGFHTDLEYMDSPWNFNHSKAMAKILWGLTGFLGGLNFAVVAIISGLLELKNDLFKKSGGGAGGSQ